jgi:two-component system response regulator VicR
LCPTHSLGSILVVEDEWLLRDNIVTELLTEGWEVTEASSGERALELLSTNRFEALFTDINLGGLVSGWDVGEALRRKDARASIVYASGNAPDKLRQVPGSLFFAKPYVASEVAKACRRCTEAQAMPCIWSEP